MGIGAFVRRAGISVDTARFYERIGLLEPARLANNYRIYGAAELERMRFIAASRSSGFSLQEIQEFLRLAALGKRACADHAAAVQMKLNELDEKIRTLRKARAELKRVMLSCSPGGGQCGFAPAGPSGAV